LTCVLVTRPAHQAEPLCRLLEQAGVSVVRMPLIDINPIEPKPQQLELLEQPPKIDWIIFISANAVNFALLQNNGRIRDYCKIAKIAAIGQASAKALLQAGLAVDAMPQQGFTSEAFLTMPQFQAMQKQRCLIVRGVGGRETLAETLKARGAQVDYMEVYARQMPLPEPDRLITFLQATPAGLITLYSSETMQHLLAQLPLQPWRNRLLSLPLVVISDRLARIARECGFTRVTVSDNADDGAVFKTIIDLVSGEYSG
jgi:uroporphyrinogen-III synthase